MFTKADRVVLANINLFTSAFTASTTVPNQHVNSYNSATTQKSSAEIPMSTKKAKVRLGSENWAFYMRLMQTRKGLLTHVEVVKPKTKITEA